MQWGGMLSSHAGTLVRPRRWHPSGQVLFLASLVSITLTTPLDAVMNAGYRIELALAADIAEMPHASYKIVLVAGPAPLTLFTVPLMCRPSSQRS